MKAPVNIILKDFPENRILCNKLYKVHCFSIVKRSVSGFWGRGWDDFRMLVCTYLLSGTWLYDRLAEHLTAMNFSHAVNCILTIDIIFNVQWWRSWTVQMLESSLSHRWHTVRNSELYERPRQTAYPVDGRRKKGIKLV